jgi:hypothetical protein
MEQTISFVILVALTTGIVQAVKSLGANFDKFTALVGLMIGIGLTYLANATGAVDLVILGSLPLTAIAVGLASCGLFDQSKIFGKKTA